MSNIKKFIVGKPLAWLTTLIYFTSYMTRKNFATVLQQVIFETGKSKDALSVILVSMTITYGVGQIISGRLGDKIKPTNLIFCGLIMATSINIVFPFVSNSIIVMAILWGLNGFAHSMMWPPIVKILVTNCDDDMYSYSVVRISWGSSFATIALYVIAPVIIAISGTWKALFFVSAAIGLYMCVTWFFLKKRINTASPNETTTNNSDCGFRIPKKTVFPIIFIIFGIIFQGMLRDGIATWMPTYLVEIHNMSNEESIFSAVFPAIFSILTFSLSNWLYKKFFTNEVVCGAVIFGVATLSSAVIFLFHGMSYVVAIVCFTLITGCMHGINLMLITHVPKRFKKYGNISTFAGVVNACTYVGEAIFLYGIAAIANAFDWKTSIGVCVVIAALGTVSCIIAAIPWKKFSEQ